MVLWFPRLRLRWPSEDFGPPRRFRRPALRVSSCEVCGPPSCVGDGSLVLPRSFFFRAGDFVIGGGFPAALSLLHGSGGASCSSGRPDPVLLEVPLSLLLFSLTATALCLAVLLWWATSLVVRSGLLCFTSAKGWKLPVIPVVGWGFVLLVGFDVLSGAPHLASEVWILSAFRVPGWSLLSSSSFLVFGLMVMRELCAGAHGCLRASRLAKSWGPMADDLFSRMACSFTMPCLVSDLQFGR